MKKHWLLILSLPFFTACASRQYYISPDYKNLRIEQANLVIPTVDDVKISQDENLFDENEIAFFKKAYFEILGSNFRENIKILSTFDRTDYVQFSVAPEFKKEIFEIGKDETVQVDVPVKRFDLKNEGKNFVLFLQDLRIYIIKQEKETSDPAKHYNVAATPAGDPTLSNRKLIDHFVMLQMKYVLYDNSNGTVVSCGQLQDKEKYELYKNFEDYLKNAFITFADRIIDGSPFSKR